MKVLEEGKRVAGNTLRRDTTAAGGGKSSKRPFEFQFYSIMLNLQIDSCALLKEQALRQKTN